MKIILVILDGLGDRSYRELNYRTPLQAAETPNMNRLAQLGGNGLFHASLPGQCLPSETAHYLLFGYEMETFPGRGLLEAVGANINFNEKDILSMAHLSSVSTEKGIPILAGGRKSISLEPDQISQLYNCISSYEIDEINFRLERTGFNDGILVMSGEASPYVSDSDPMIVGRAMAMVKPLSANAEPEASHRTAKAINTYLAHCQRILSTHPVNKSLVEKDSPPANFLATQRAGRRIVQQPFFDKWGLKGMMLSSGHIFAGLALELGMTLVRVEDGDDPGNDIRDRLDLAVNDTEHDFIHVHTKAPDEAAHRGDPAEKTRIISSLDRGLDKLIKEVEERDDLIVAVTSDHSTPCVSNLIHSGEPVPVMIAGPNIRRDEVNAFDEIHSAAGCLGLLRGGELISTLLNCAERSSLIGHCLGESQRAYFPEDYEPFK
ncbi:alkaline phosphatase family protein [Thermodesulfobacteriota bacterium]